MKKPSHYDSKGRIRMVDVTAKAETQRTAMAHAFVRMRRATIASVRRAKSPKGDPVEIARIAGITAAKRTAELIPLAHPLMLTRIAVEFAFPADASAVAIEVTVETRERTGVEMEALTAVSAGLLTVYDMCKAVDRGMRIGDVRLVEKLGGRSGHYRAE